MEHPLRPWEMKKSDLLRAIQNEIQRHNLSTFMSKEHKIVQTGAHCVSAILAPSNNLSAT